MSLGRAPALVRSNGEGLGIGGIRVLGLIDYRTGEDMDGLGERPRQWAAINTPGRMSLRPGSGLPMEREVRPEILVQPPALPQKQADKGDRGCHHC